MDNSSSNERIEKARDARKALNYVVERLGELSTSAWGLGFDKMAKKLNSLAEHTREATENLYDAWNEEFLNHCDSIEESTNNTVKAGLAMTMNIADDFENE